MSRILEFQPTDEQTIVARVLVELHQAIDASFPNARPSAKQFSRTVLTHQGESTRIDNMPQSTEDRASAGGSDAGQKISRSHDQISMTPNTGINGHANESPMHTGQLKSILGESSSSKAVQRILWLLLLIGIAVFFWLSFVGPEIPWLRND